MMTKTHTIILAQGRQTRLPGFKVNKQLLTLPMHAACDAPNWQIMQRTIAQVLRMQVPPGTLIQDAQEAFGRHELVVVGWPSMRMDAAQLPCMEHPELGSTIDFTMYPRVVTLDDPGNSSLVGIDRYLANTNVRLAAEAYGGLLTIADTYDRYITNTNVRLAAEAYGGLNNTERIVVLLGDVVYSWACLEALYRDAPVTFAGTPDLDGERGELWGIAFGSSATPDMTRSRAAAMRARSKAEEDAYQPGQLRHWLWAYDHLRTGFHSVVGERDWWVPIDDYTMDVDLPEHLVQLAESSIQAYAEDRERGMIIRG